MKITALIMFILIIGIVFFGITTMSNDLNTAITETNGSEINTSLWEGEYNYTEQINRTIAPVVSDFERIRDGSNGWSILGAGLVAIPNAVIGFAALAISSISIFTTMITGASTYLGIPSFIIYTFITIVGVWLISKLLQFFAKEKA